LITPLSFDAKEPREYPQKQWRF